MARGKTLDEDMLTDSTYYIMLTLVRPMHGYGIMQEVEKNFDGEAIIGPASLYTIIKKLQSAELIELLDDNEDRRRTYALTLKGKEILKKDINRRMIMAKHGEQALKYLEVENGHGE